ncbi:MAP3K7 C-terminal-like protein [Cololabis saira]|uniref:MAP3K7 C-terminal-like protein n=1 Tax=Cololabis saira TaxID=129043 RepID=UPI002AD20292|nr:MAP3K7 C-terminal-like protein [Cololabis saira]
MHIPAQTPAAGGFDHGQRRQREYTVIRIKVAPSPDLRTVEVGIGLLQRLQRGDLLKGPRTFLLQPELSCLGFELLQESMITSSRRVSPDKSEVRITFSLDDKSDGKDVDDHSRSLPDLEQRLQPVPPCVSLRESVHVYKQHCRMAREFHQVKHDMAVLEDRKRKLLADLVEDENVAVEIARLEDEFRRLTEENRTLVTLHRERTQQLERLCPAGRRRQDSW